MAFRRVPQDLQAIERLWLNAHVLLVLHMECLDKPLKQAPFEPCAGRDYSSKQYTQYTNDEDWENNSRA